MLAPLHQQLLGGNWGEYSEKRGILLVGGFWSANIVSREDEGCTMEAHHIRGLGGVLGLSFIHMKFLLNVTNMLTKI